MDEQRTIRPNLLTMSWAMLTLGLVSIGGNNALLMTQMVVERRHWLTDEDMDAAIAAATMAPGGNSSNLSYEVGRRVRGVSGGLVSYVSMALPGMILVVTLGSLLLKFDGKPRISGLLDGAQAAAVALVTATAWRLRKRSVKKWLDWALVAALFVLVGILRWPIELCVPPVILAAWLARRRGA